MLDCRWLGSWGPGRVTELLLRGLSENPPSGHWLLWGPPAVESFTWSGASTHVTERDPRAWRAQRAWFEVPSGRLTFFLHQQRPLRRLPAVTLVYDTIQLRYGCSGWEARLRAAYLKRAVASSRHVVTISEYSRRCIRRDLDVDADRVTAVALPLDVPAAHRLADLRRQTPERQLALFVGRFAAHKNLDRLRAAFGRTAFCRDGGRLVLAGGSAAEVARLSGSLSPDERRFVEVRGRCRDDELQTLMASARFLVQPSLEEGYGLPVVEAIAGGLPVCVSDGGALPEVTRGLVPTFPADSVEDMARALDETAERAGDRDRADALARQFRAMMPTTSQYAAEVAAIVRRALDGS